MVLCCLCNSVAIDVAEPTSNVPIRLAIISETPSLAPILDLLTADFSQGPAVQVLERAEIERIYREQRISSANRDDIRLGRLLGADGLLILSLIEETNAPPLPIMAASPAAQRPKSIEARLVAVKPGAIIEIVRSSMRDQDAVGWSSGLAAHLHPFLPKLGVQKQDILPISIVNLRAAQASPAAHESEGQLTMLIIERLTRERSFFVLERRRLQLLAGEKELSADETAFWNGSYLFEGIIDRDGYSPAKITIDATLKPPGAAPPLSISVSGSRTNPGEVVTSLAQKIIEVLQPGSKPQPWSAAQEAQHYYDEAQWGLKWKAVPQAQAAVESAWALGKQDRDCALARVNAWLPDVRPANTYSNMLGSYPATESENPYLRDIQAVRPAAYAMATGKVGSSRTVRYQLAPNAPNAQMIQPAIHLLRVYSDFSRTLPAEEPVAASPWYNLGLKALEQSSQVLQAFHFVPNSQRAVAGELSELRELSRETAAWLSRSPSVSNGYWFTSANPGRYDQLYHTLGEDNSIFRCKVKWGCFWQERPEDTLPLYRELMTSLAFSYIHGTLFSRDLISPRLAAWNDNDRKRLPDLWRAFLSELSQSTNPICQIEAKYIELADANDIATLPQVVEHLFDTLQSQAAFLAANPVEPAYGRPEDTMLVDATIRSFTGGIFSEETETLSRRIGQLWAGLSQSLTEEKRAAEQRSLLEKRKAYLVNQTPFEFGAFARLFLAGPYSKSEATELQAPLAAYKSNLLAQTQNANDSKAAFKLRSAIDQVTGVESRLKAAAETSATKTPGPIATAGQPTPSVQTSLSARSAPANLSSGASNSATASPLRGPQGFERPTRGAAQQILSPAFYASNALPIAKFVPVPIDRLGATNIYNVQVFAERWSDNHVLLDLRYNENVPAYYDEISGVYHANSMKFGAGAAIFNPLDNSWRTAAYPARDIREGRIRVGTMNPNQSGLYLEIFEGDLYVSDWEVIQKLSFKTGRWEALPFPGQKLAELTVINRHLYAASEDAIFEIADHGMTTRVLASCRRRPAVTTLDSFESLGHPLVFQGPQRNLRAVAAEKLFQWNGKDWTEIASLPNGVSAQACGDALLLRVGGFRQPAKFWALRFDQDSPDLFWREESADSNPPGAPPHAGPAGGSPAPITEQAPRWNAQLDVSLVRRPATVLGSNIFVFVDRTDGANGGSLGEQPASQIRAAELVCFLTGLDRPLILPLKLPPNPSTPPRPNSTSGSRLAPWQVGAWVLATPEQLLIGKINLAGFWVLPRTELDRALAAEAKRLAPRQPL